VTTALRRSPSNRLEYLLVPAEHRHRGIRIHSLWTQFDTGAALDRRRQQQLVEPMLNRRARTADMLPVIA